MFQSRAISSQRPKCVNLAQAGTNAYETVGSRRVKDINAINAIHMNVLKSMQNLILLAINETESESILFIEVTFLNEVTERICKAFSN